MMGEQTNLPPAPFTDALDLYFINDTPQVDGTGILHAQFKTNRPDSDDVELILCLVGRTGRDSTQDCK